MIRNISTKKVLSENAKKAKGLSDLFLGMILERNSEGLIYQSRFGIHTFFMSKSIDVLILDKKKKVVAIRENLKPFRIYVWSPKFDLILELPEGSIKQSETKIGDEIELSFRTPARKALLAWQAGDPESSLN